MSKFGLFLFSTIFIVLVSTLSEVLVIYGVSDEILYIVIFPVAEELFKIYIVTKSKLSPFKSILIFAFSEFIFVKMPLFDFSLDQVNLKVIAASLIVVAFHLATSELYKGVWATKRVSPILFYVILLHSVFNLLSFLNLSSEIYLGLIAIFCILPLVSRHALKIR